MNSELPNLHPPSDWEQRKANRPSPPRGGLTVLTPSDRIFEAYPLEDGRGLRLVGELCFSTVGDLLGMLDTLPAGADVLDLADLSFMDSSGLHAFERYARRLESRPLVLRNVPGHVRRLFELTGAHRNPHIEILTDGGRG